ncbi:FtsX-like permease family protein, partial [Pseudomonas aeruginosa]|nr:FtsX-like permease family protein [Pseudomonas aeruginosa]
RSPAAEVSHVVARVSPGADVYSVGAALGAALTARLPGHEAQVQVSQQVLDGLKRQTRTFTYLLAGLGIISLLGGGVGVMNVMLMSVAERRREIGVRMALGARQRDIRNLFLIEAVTLTAAGALSGAVLGVAAAYLYARFSGWTFSLAYAALPLGMGSTLLVGLFFGLYPAVSAARLQPVEALRDE